MFRHPKYYKELRKRNRDLSELQQVKLERSVPQSDQAISLRAHDGECERAPGSWPNSSEVVTSGATCPAPKQNNECRDCRACWDATIKTVSYGKH